MRGPNTRLHGRIPGNRGPCSTYRRVADSGRNPCGWRGLGFWLQTLSFLLLDAVKSLAHFAKTVTAQRMFHYVMGSKCHVPSIAE